MSRVHKLIAELASRGVELRALGDIATTVPGLSGKTKADFSKGNARYVSYKNAFGNLSVDQSADEFVQIGDGEKQNRLHLGDVVITGSSESLDEVGMSSVVATEPIEPLYLNSFCFAVRFRDTSILLPEFSKYLFRSESVRTQIRRAANGVTRINVSKPRFMKVQVPLPPLEVQREIVRILDRLTPLEAELGTQLEREMEARSRQYAHYRSELLTFDTQVERAYLGEIATIGTGSHDTKDAVSGGAYAFYARGREPLRLDTFDFEERAIITAGDGVGVGKVFHFAAGKYALHQRAYRVVPDEKVDARYIYHYLVAQFAQYLERTSLQSSVTSLRRPMFLQFPVALPPFAEQRRIACALDELDALINELRTHLAAEVAARHRQYEFHRRKLLTFKETAA